MSTIVSMWLGVAFVALGIIATVLQAWLWSFPMEPDPGGPDPNGKSTAPRLWTNAHRIAGVLFVLIYIVLMWEMFPRLWEYQTELPARTVIHAVMGLCIGIILITKLAIIRWFQHFGTSLPTLGFLLLLCTLILAALSLPHAFRAYHFRFTPEDIEKAQSTLQREAAWIAGSDVDEKKRNKLGFTQHKLDDVASEQALREGQEILATKCTGCHDLKTAMGKTNNANIWYKTVVRMAEKPTMGELITEDDIPKVTAYLVLVTSPLREQKIQQRREKQKTKQARKKAQEAVVPQKAPSPTQPEGTPPTEQPEGTAPAKQPEEAPKFDATAIQVLFEDTCTLCHELDLVEGYGEHTADEWRELVVRMSDEEGGEFEPEDMEKIIQYLTSVHGSK